MLTEIKKSIATNHTRVGQETVQSGETELVHCYNTLEDFQAFDKNLEDEETFKQFVSNLDLIFLNSFYFIYFCKLNI